MMNIIHRQFFNVVKKGNIEIVKTFLGLEDYLDINQQDHRGNTVLIIACMKPKQYDMIRLLLENNANPNIINKSGLISLNYTLRHEPIHTRKPIVELLLKHRVNVKLSLPLLDAVAEYWCYPEKKMNNHLMCEIVTELLQNGAKINVKYKDGCTLFNYAIRTRNVRMAELLVKNACYVRTKSSHLEVSTDKSFYPPWYQLLIDSLSNECCVYYAEDDDEDCFKKTEKLNRLYFGAGETVNEGDIQQPLPIVRLACSKSKGSLMSITRSVIRSTLLDVSNVNLITQVKQLPLPPLIKKYLCYEM